MMDSSSSSFSTGVQLTADQETAIVLDLLDNAVAELRVQTTHMGVSEMRNRRTIGGYSVGFSFNSLYKLEFLCLPR